MKKSAQTSTAAPSTKGPGIVSIIAIIGILISIVLALVVLIMPSVSPRSSRPTVVFAGDFDSFPNRSMTNTIHAAGFNIEVADGEPRVKDDCIIVGVGDNSFDYVNMYRDNDNVKGIVLVCPTFPEGSKVNGMNAQNPAKDIAIFAGKDNAQEVAYIGDARLIYERLSGDDTVYGTPIKRGGIFSSKNYVNNGQNRMLSLSAFRVKSGEELLFSPLFQNELAGYLSNSYSDNKAASYARINAYFILTVISMVLAVVSTLLLLSDIAVTMSKYVVPKLCYALVAVSVAIVTVVLVCGGLISRTSEIACNGITAGSCIILTAAAVIVDFYFATKKFGRVEVTSPRKGNKTLSKINNIVLMLAPIVLVLEYLFILADMSCNKILLVIIFAIVDFLSFAILAYLGGKMVWFVQFLAILSGIAIMIAGIVGSQHDMVSSAEMMMAVTLATMVVSFPSIRHSTNPFFTGITHSVTTLLFLIALL